MIRALVRLNILLGTIFRNAQAGIFVYRGMSSGYLSTIAIVRAARLLRQLEKPTAEHKRHPGYIRTSILSN